MAAGVSEARADAMLDTITTPYVQLHIGNPGPYGTGNQSSEEDRVSITLDASAGGMREMAAPVSWVNWAFGSENITHISVWSAASGGNFEFSAALTGPTTVNYGETFTLQLLQVYLLNIAA